MDNVEDGPRRARGLRLADELRQDGRYAWRGLRRSPVFAWIAVASLALGIGANTAIFSFVDAVLLQRLAVTEPDRLVTFARTHRGERSGVVWTSRTVDALAERTPAFAGVFGWFSRPISFSASGDGGGWVNGELVTGGYYRTLGVSPAVGRLFDDDDVRNAAADPVCVLGYGLWRRAFGGDPGVVGRTVFLNGRGYRVVGVAERGFHGAELHRRFDVGVPATRAEDFLPAFSGAAGALRLGGLSWLVPMARLQDGVTRAEAERQARLALQAIDPDRPGELWLDDGAQGLNTARSTFGAPVLVAMGLASLVLLVACANLANLLLARAQARAGELRVRLCLGASRARLVRQLLVEVSALAAAGGLAGVALAYWIRGALLGILNAGRTAASAVQVPVDADVLVFSVLATATTAVLCGVVPAWRATRPDLARRASPAAPLTAQPTLPGVCTVLRRRFLARQSSPDGSAWRPTNPAGVRAVLRRRPLVSGVERGPVAAGGSVGRGLASRALVVVQIAVCLAVVFAAGLLTQTLRTLTTVDLGFEPDRVIALRVDPAAGGRSGAAVSAVFDEMLARARELPGVAAASLAASPPYGAMSVTMGIDVPGYVPAPGRGDTVVGFNFVSPRYFETLGQDLIRGRDFDERDERGRPLATIVNERFVEHYFDGRDPLGRRLRQGAEELEIVGVVADARDRGVRSGPADTVYVHRKQGPPSGMTLLVRAGDDPARIVPALLALAGSIDPRMPVTSVHTLDVDVEAGLSSERMLGYLSALFAGLTLLLAGIGLYGVLASAVVRRTREIGLRLALGAQRRDVVVLLGRESAVLLLLGVAAGGCLAVACARVMRGVLFGVTATDAPTLVAGILLLGGVALLATAAPLRRATRVDPMVALRSE